MNQLFTFTCAALAVLPCVGQNLVPNPSFEQLSQCPDFASELQLAVDWMNPNLGTPELYNACAPFNSYVSVPYNATGGYQFARTGQGYAGLFTWRSDIANMREYAQTALTEPLQAGVCYRVTMYVNMPNDNPYACDGFGAYLSTDPVSSTDGMVIPVTPQVQRTAGSLITDTLGWTEITGVYTALGGEAYLTIGNFKDDANTQTALVNIGVWYETSAYLLVDDISVEPLDLALDLGPDTTLCAGGSITLDATTADASYQWNDGSTAPVRTVTQAGIYSVIVSVGECSVSDTVVIGVGPVPSLSLPGEVHICQGASVELDASVAGASVLWSDGDTTAKRTITDPGTYTVAVTNACGSSSASTTVISELCPCVPYLPNAFTPNDDGINDTAGPVFECEDKELSWTVFDRWGSIVFSAHGGNDLWDGTMKGLPAPTGVYTWQINVPGRSDIYRGHLTLLR